MVKNYGVVFLTSLWLVCNVCSGAPIGNIQSQSKFEKENAAFLRNEEFKKTQIRQNHGSYPSTSMYNPFQRYTKKSDMPEKGQIKFMKSLLGKVKTLLHSEDGLKKEKSNEKKVVPDKTPEKISAVASDNDKLYGVLGNSKENDSEKSVNVISIPLNALKKFTDNQNSENDLPRVQDPKDSDHLLRGTQVFLKPVSVRLASEENKGMTSFVPVLLQNQVPRLQPVRSYGGYLPDGPDSDSYGTSRIPFAIERHAGISRHNKDDEGLYRDIGHIPGEISYHHEPSESHEEIGQASLRHKNPVRYHHFREDDDYDDDEDDNDEEDDEEGEDDDDDDEDDDDDDEDDDESDDEFDYRNSPRMRAEERQIAATRKRLYDMLPGNDPTYTSENRGLGLPMRPSGMLQMPEAFLGNPMIQPGGAFNPKNLLPSVGAALAGEHADNSNERNVFMFGGQGSKQVYGNSDSNMEDPPVRQSAMKVNSGGFILGGSHAQALSPNEVSYLLQKQSMPNRFDGLTQKDKIYHPRHKTEGVLLKVNGRAIGDSRELRDHVVNGVVFKGKEKVFKSKGPVDVKVSKATDGVHSKVVDITSAGKVNVLNAKSRTAKSL